MGADGMILIKGDRVKLSKLAVEKNIRPGKTKVHGIITTNRSRMAPLRASYSVLWDDRKTTERLHEDFVEKVKL
jgi:hypothetical protein